MTTPLSDAKLREMGKRDTIARETPINDPAAINRLLHSQADVHPLLAEVNRLRTAQPRMFPIQQGSPVPWECAERAYSTYAKLFGSEQSLQRLGERGGFGVQEFACLFNGHEPQRGHQECIESADNLARELARLRQSEADLRHVIELAVKLIDSDGEVNYPQPHPQILTLAAAARMTMKRFAEEQADLRRLAGELLDAGQSLHDFAGEPLIKYEKDYAKAVEAFLAARALAAGLLERLA